MNSNVVITDYIEHIMTESDRIMEGTKFESNWMIYHDALSLMTAERTKEWMESKGYLKRFNPLGNSPEFMPWDAHLNQDVHSSVDHHVLLTKNLEPDDRKKFALSTPKLMSNAYNRLLHPTTGVTPTPQRIIQDITIVLHAMEAVKNNNGCMIIEKNILMLG